MADPAPPNPTEAAPPPRRRRWFPRVQFSLLTLVIFVLLISSGFGLWYRWEPWVLIRVFRSWEGVRYARITMDGKCIGATDDRRVSGIWDIASGEELPSRGDGVPLGLAESELPQVIVLTEKNGTSARVVQRERDGLGAKEIATLKGDVSSIRHGIYLQKARRILATSETTSTLWDADTGDRIPWRTCSTACVSPDQTRVVTKTQGGAFVWATADGRRLASLRGEACIPGDARFSPDGSYIVMADGSARVFSRRRPEYWWGLAWLPEFWLTLLFAGALVVSVMKDRQHFEAQAATDSC